MPSHTNLNSRASRPYARAQGVNHDDDAYDGGQQSPGRVRYSNPFTQGGGAAAGPAYTTDPHGYGGASSLELQIRQLQVELQQKDQAYANLHKGFGEVKAALDATRAHVGVLEEDLRETQDQASRRHAKLKADLELERSKHAEYKDHYRTSEKRRERLEKENDQLEKENDRLRGKAHGGGGKKHNKQHPSPPYEFLDDSALRERFNRVPQQQQQQQQQQQPRPQKPYKEPWGPRSRRNSMTYGLYAPVSTVSTGLTEPGDYVPHPLPSF